MNQHFNNLDKRKAKLLEDFTKMAEGKTTDELLPLILAISKKAKSEGISFTKEETSLLFENMKKNMSPEEQQKADMLLKMASILQEWRPFNYLTTILTILPGTQISLITLPVNLSATASLAFERTESLASSGAIITTPLVLPLI